MTYMHPRPDPARDIEQVRAMLQREHGTDWDLTDVEIDAAVEAARARIGGRRQSRSFIAAQDLARQRDAGR